MIMAASRDVGEQERKRAGRQAGSNEVGRGQAADGGQS